MLVISTQWNREHPLSRQSVYIPDCLALALSGPDIHLVYIPDECSLWMMSARLKKTSPWLQAVRGELEFHGSRVYLQADLQSLLERAHDKHLVPSQLSLPAFLEKLVATGVLRQVELRGAPSASTTKERRPFKRYIFGTPPPYALALSLRPRSYLSHGSAIVLHDLTDRRDLPVYVNQEQSPKPPATGVLEQSAIDRAFRNRVRSSTYVFEYEGADIVLLSGKNTGNYGVTQMTDESGGTFDVTSVARTLLDITVRPSYAGGPAPVLEAYRRALALQPVESLIQDTLQSLDVADYVYPYHQLIGFYLERAGANPHLTEELRSRGLAFDFYVDYHMREPMYDPQWRVHYPADLH